jgi:DNA-binding response OmpR family regulator
MTGAASTLVFGAVELRLAERQLRVEGQPVALGGRGFDLLKALVLKRERTVTKDELLDEVWPGLVVEENNLQVQISGLRRVLGAQAIATVAGIGYRFTLAEGGRDGRAVAVPSAPPAPTIASARVLVADDNRVNRLLLCRSLELMGHQVDSADNGRQALDMLRRQRFELLLLDLAMPELDGFGLLQARAADAALREVAVIVTSALGGVAPVARCIELGADDFLHKPVDPWLLKARVDSSLLAKRQRDLQGAALRRAMPDGLTQPGARDDATVLVTRLHGLEGAGLSAQQLMELLDHWSTLMIDAVERHGGQVLQFSGDGLLALFDAPTSAMPATQDMAEVLRLFNDERRTAGLSAVGMGSGLARGAVVVGMAATAHRAACACVGAAAGRAHALSASCAAAGHALLMDDATQAALAAGVQTVALVLPGVGIAHASAEGTVRPA